MATERLSPDALTTQTGLTGTVAAIDEDPDSPDASWLTTTNNTNTVCHVTFPSPTGNPTTGAGLQEIKAWVRKTNHSTNPTAVLDLYENGNLVATLVSSTTISSTTGQMLSGTWDAASLGTANGSLVEARVTGTVGGGSPGNRASVEIGAIEWNVTYSTTAEARGFAQAQAYIKVTEIEAVAQAQASIAGSPIAADDFSDDQTNTWNTADIGGIWTTTVAGNGSANNVDKVSGKGVMLTTATNSTLRVALQQVYVTNQDALVKIQTNRAPVGGTYQVFVDVRYINPSNYYRAEVQFRTDGNLHGRIERILDGVYANLTGSEPQILGLTYSVDTDYYIRVEAKGSGTTTLKMKVWPVGTDEPSTWHDTRTDTSAALQVSSGVALQAWSNAHTDYTGDGLQFKWDDLNVNRWFGYGQAQAQIKQTYQAFAQAQAEIQLAGAVIVRVHAQAQAQIKQTYNGLAQAQADIKQTYFGLAQAQADIKQTYNSFGQAQADIKQTYYGLGQAQAQIKTTYYGLAQSQADIKQVYHGLGQAQADIKQTYYGLGQAEAWIETTYNSSGQAQAQIKQTYNAHANAQGTILTNYQAYGQAQGQIKQTYFGLSQANAYIYRIEHGLGQTQGQIKQTYSVHAQAQAFIVIVTYAFAQAQTWIEATYHAFAQAEASILGDTIIGRGFGQAQAQINAFDVNAHGQSQADIKQTYQGYGQSQAVILATYQEYGQAQGTILQTYTVFAQAQALIKTTYQGYSQAQALIGSISQGYGQAQGTILATQVVHGQAQGTILQIYQQYGQAQAWIITTVNSYAQAQALIVIIGQGYAQAEAFIVGALFGHAQARAVIVTTNTMESLSISDRASMTLELSDHADVSNTDEIMVEILDRASFTVTLTDKAY